MNEIKAASVNRAKLYQLVLFPFNNGATNVYYILTMNYIAYHANGVLGLALMFATTMVTVMRVFDAFTDPIIGMLIDKTSGKLGKFRPYIILGNGIMAVSAVILYFGTRMIPEDMMWLRYTGFVLMYMLYVIGYTFQTACTRSGQTVLTNDPKQRPLFTIFNTVASLVGMGLIQIVATVVGGKVGYGSEAFFNFVIPLAIILSAVLTLLAVIGIWEKDRPEYFGIAGEKKEKVKLKEYADILVKNKELRMLMLAGGSTKLAFSIATNASVACMLYASMMGNYSGLYLPIYIICYAASVPFFLLSVRTAQKKGQKAALAQYTRVALICYVGVLALLLFWKEGSVLTTLSLSHLNLYTILFILCYAVGYGAYYSTADMPIPMVADCSDYETYRSGKYVPGIMGTLFSLVDKLVSSLGSTVVGIAVMAIGIQKLPDTNTPYMEGMKWVVIVLFCIIPMIAWILTLYAMHRYSLSGDRMREIQEVNAARKQAVSEGMDIEEAMEKWKTLKDLEEKK
ncbi:MFS transporter [Mediterraneibacter sp. NSJ-55]|uniref:MFS transporter n=1 Tax=Mediterraneibacter hominis TaxID=2763054 RepID=A0A923RPZ2_9FIRM|nr:MFS transporter [Mediterraneibacter hominis]MBC5688980.1 MFS transporter [Mediterraneibacter hominis]